MINFQQILNGDSGLSARSKINSVLTALVSGEEGINASWILLRALQDSLGTLAGKEEDDIALLQENIEGANNYTDKAVGKLYTYIDAMSGGVGGLVDSTSYDPSDLPTDKAITLIALGAGTFTNLKDVTDTPITISNANSVTVFYRAANISYWNYKSMVISAPAMDQVPTSGNTDHVVSSDGIYKDGLKKLAQVGYYPTTISDGSVVVSVADAPDYVLTKGGCVRLKMLSAGTTASTLKIGNADAKELWYNGAAVSSDNTWEAGEIISVFYDGTRFMASNSQGGGKFKSGQKLKDIGIVFPSTSDITIPVSQLSLLERAGFNTSKYQIKAPSNPSLRMFVSKNISAYNANYVSIKTSGNISVSVFLFSADYSGTTQADLPRSVPTNTIVSSHTQWETEYIAEIPDGAICVGFNVQKGDGTSSVSSSDITDSTFVVKLISEAEDDSLYSKGYIDNLIYRLDREVEELKPKTYDHTYTGERIDLRNRSYNLEKIINLTAPTSYNGVQSLAVKDNTLIIGRALETSGKTDYLVYVNGTFVDDLLLQHTGYSAIHSNTICFGEDSQYNLPLLYASQWDEQRACFVYEIDNSYNATLVRVIDPANLSASRFGAGAADWIVGDGYLYSIAYIVDSPYPAEGNGLRVCKFALPTGSGVINLADSDIIESYDIEPCFVRQDSFYHNGKIYTLFGGGSVYQEYRRMQVLDVVKKAVVSIADMTYLTSEPEAISMYNGDLVMMLNSVSNGVLKFIFN